MCKRRDAAAYEQPETMSYEQFYKQEHGRLIGIAYRILRNRQEAEDVVGGVMLKLLERWQTIEALDVAAYAARMVSNAAIDELKHRMPTDELSEEQSPLVSAPDHNIIDREYAAELRAALARLPEAQRMALLLKQERGLGYSEVASVMGETEANVRQLVSRARRQLARLMHIELK